jgi:acyl carrier protein
MTREEIRGKVSAFIKQNYLFDDTKEIDSSASFLGTGILDSTGILEMITFVEEEFGVTFLDEELTSENFDSIDRVVAMLERKKGNVAA